MSHPTYSITPANYEGRALGLSMFLHVSVIGFYFFSFHPKPLDIIPSQPVVLEISSIERSVPKPIVSTPPEPVREIKKEEPIKPIETLKPKTILKPKPIVRQEVAPTPMVEPMHEISQSAPVPETQSVATPSPAPIPASTQSEPYLKTDFKIIRDKVLSRLVYPSIARRMSWTGVVHVALVIDTDGKLVGATIHQSSGKSVLDDAALEAAFKLKSDLLPKPQRLSTVVLPIAFKLK